MPDDTPTSNVAEWTRAVDLARLQPSRPIAVKLRGKHIALFLHQGEVLACNNRCPHEGRSM
jgi:nitrite reductase/ring-hydroxylating ferredoxin subunit